MGVLTYKPLPLIPWMGGKRRLAKHILPLFPEHQCYVELFAGGAALFFLRQKPAKAEVLNDINGDLVNLYRVVQHHFDEFIRQFDFTLTSREYFRQLQQTPPATLTDIQRAARFFYLQHTAFGAKPIDQHFGTATTGKAFNPATVRQKLAAAQQRLGGVYIENEPWQACLKRYDRPHTFFYADPPYWQTAGYTHDFAWEEYERLAEEMGRIQGKMMLSINDHPDILALFKPFNIVRLELAYSVGRDKTQRPSGELVICNY
ncbi:DNA adenine methylase [Neisseria leonii]|uniref:site-specific DNA-methyltransferase (adenine-specific) n=1 Tax=Neisseria leonii TaxID=2995413 RepID=A0A9X4IDI1_9NEIS|nr:DNA adenine methylase [Neisseria sp. 51.81]MDD9327716.1 DNA adenine methylase [Neisseria sp. 51.81]